MIDPIVEFLEDRDDPLCITRSEAVGSALATMVEHDYSQLPVVDSDGRILGMISEQSLTRHLYHFGDGTAMLELTVDHCMDDAVTLSLNDTDLFTVLERLQNCYALVITDDRKPVGIITNYDTTDFFRDWSEGLIRIQNIELTLRQYIEEVFTTDEALNAALYRVLGEDKKDPSKPRKAYEDLSFGDHTRLILSDEYWERFSTFFGPESVFRRMMEPVSKARNQLAHFRGSLEPTQADAVKRAQSWLARRPKQIRGQATISLEGVTLNATGVTGNLTVVSGKYGTLEQWLDYQAATASQDDVIRLSFNEIEELIKDSLPASAREHRAWWANDSTSRYRHSRAWLNSGWEVSAVDFPNEAVSFRRTDKALYKVFWSDLAERLASERPSLKRLSSGYDNYYLLFDSRKKGLYFGWIFSQDRQQLWTQLLIDTRHTDSSVAKRYFNQLRQQQGEIEKQFGEELHWDDHSMQRAVRIYATHPVNINSTPEELDVVKRWAVDSLVRLADTMQPRISELS